MTLSPDVKPFQKITGRSQADHFDDPQSMPRIFKIKKNGCRFKFWLFYHVSTVYYGG